jgi:hypothetical protein
MPIVKRPGDTLKIRGALYDKELNKTIAGARVVLQQHDPATGLWIDITETTTGADGSYLFEVKLPEAEGTIRLRTYFPGSDEWKADASPAITVVIKRPKAAPTALAVLKVE